MDTGSASHVLNTSNHPLWPCIYDWQSAARLGPR